MRVRGAGAEREPGPERRLEGVVSAKIPLKFRVQRSGEWLPLLFALGCFNRAALAPLFSGLSITPSSGSWTRMSISFVFKIFALSPVTARPFPEVLLALI